MAATASVETAFNNEVMVMFWFVFPFGVSLGAASLGAPILASLLIGLTVTFSVAAILSIIMIVFGIYFYYAGWETEKKVCDLVFAKECGFGYVLRENVYGGKPSSVLRKDGSVPDDYTFVQLMSALIVTLPPFGSQFLTMVHRMNTVMTLGPNRRTPEVQFGNGTALSLLGAVSTHWTVGKHTGSHKAISATTEEIEMRNKKLVQGKLFSDLYQEEARLARLTKNAPNTETPSASIGDNPESHFRYLKYGKTILKLDMRKESDRKWFELHTR